MSKSNSGVLFSSVEQFTNSSDLYPTHDRQIGIAIGINSSGSIQIEEEYPSFLSSTRGEIVDLEDVDDRLREKCKELSSNCRAIAKELITHAKRLEEVANRKDPIINNEQLAKYQFTNTSTGIPSYTSPDPSLLKTRSLKAPSHPSLRSLSSSLDLDDI